MTTDLPHCPFCDGKTAEAQKAHGYDIWCSSCEATITGHDRDDAVAKWSRRHVSAELEGYRAEAKYKSDVIARHERLEEAVNLLFPSYHAVSVRQGTANKPPIHPEKAWWWNGATIEDDDLDADGCGVNVTLQSYVGRDEYDDFRMRIPAEWIDAENRRDLILKWIKDETERRDQADRQSELRDAEDQLAAAQQRLSEAKRKK